MKHHIPTEKYTLYHTYPKNINECRQFYKVCIKIQTQISKMHKHFQIGNWIFLNKEVFWSKHTTNTLLFNAPQTYIGRKKKSQKYFSANFKADLVWQVI